jgi:hypothetical protein
MGRPVPEGLLTLAGAKLILPGIVDRLTLTHIEALGGNEWVDQVARSDMHGSVFSTQRSTKHRG